MYGLEYLEVFFYQVIFKETWESEVGPITLEFDLDNSHYRLSPNYDNDWLDLRIIVEINKILMASGKHWFWGKRRSQLRFEIIQTYDQTSFITVLSPKEKLKMEYRGFIFIEQ